MTTKAKIETAAERYRRIKAERAKDVELFDFTSPSGMVWKLRKADLGLFITSGVMPVSLAARVGELQQTSGDKSPEQVFQDLPWDDKLQSIQFAKTVVQFCAVEPRIVDTPSLPNDIAAIEVEPDDFNAIYAWALGGEEATDLGTFRNE